VAGSYTMWFQRPAVMHPYVLLLMCNAPSTHVQCMPSGPCQPVHVKLRTPRH
jgi:hypothetical protein